MMLWLFNIACPARPVKCSPRLPHEMQSISHWGGNLEAIPLGPLVFILPSLSPDWQSLRHAPDNAQTIGKSFIVFSPDGASMSLGIELTTIAAVAKSPCMPPLIITSILGLPVIYTAS